MQKRKAGVAAGAILAITATGLYFGGSTTALWSDTVSVNGGTITSGNLDVEVLETGWEDVSPGVLGDDGVNSASQAGNGNAITLSGAGSFIMTPGDVIAGTTGLDVALEGDNMLAEFKVEMPAGFTGALAAGTDVDVDATEADSGSPSNGQDALSDKGVTITYTVTDEAGVVIGTANTAPGTATVATLTPADVSRVVDSNADYTVKITATFDESTPERTRTLVQGALDNAKITLTQVRPTTP